MTSHDNRLLVAGATCAWWNWWISATWHRLLRLLGYISDNQTVEPAASAYSYSVAWLWTLGTLLLICCDWLLFLQYAGSTFFNGSLHFDLLNNSLFLFFWELFMDSIYLLSNFLELRYNLWILRWPLFPQPLNSRIHYLVPFLTFLGFLSERLLHHRGFKYNAWNLLSEFLQRRANCRSHLVNRFVKLHQLGFVLLSFSPISFVESLLKLQKPFMLFKLLAFNLFFKG